MHLGVNIELACKDGLFFYFKLKKIPIRYVEMAFLWVK